MKPKTAKLSNGINVLAIGGGKYVGWPRSWGGMNGRANAQRNAKALGLGWVVYQGEGPEFYVALANQFKKGGAVNVIAGKQPRFVLFMGTIGSGKTTIRRQKYTNGYVHIDASEIFAQLTGGKYYDFPGEFQEKLELLGSTMAKKAVNEKKNIVMEIIGDSFDMGVSIAKGLKSIGYIVEVNTITCDREEGWKRHKKACETDINYVSAFYTQKFHQKWILDAVKEFREQNKSGKSVPRTQVKEKYFLPLNASDEELNKFIDMFIASQEGAKKDQKKIKQRKIQGSRLFLTT